MRPTFGDLFRQHVGPPVEIESIVRGLGIHLDRFADLPDRITAELARLEDGRYRISLNGNDILHRQRFSMAHALGHYMMHAHLIGDGVDDDREYRSGPHGRFFNRSFGPHEENQANVFAVSVLLPARPIAHLVMEGVGVQDMAATMQASRKAMSARLKGLGYHVEGDRILTPESEAPDLPYLSA